MKAMIKRNLPDAPPPTKAVRIDNWNRSLIHLMDARQAREKEKKNERSSSDGKIDE